MLSEALRLLRIYHDLTQTELAKKLKISKSYLSEIEAGIKVPTLAVVQDYAKEFDIPASAILFFAENIEHPSSSNGRARRLVAERVLKLLRYIEERSHGRKEKKGRLSA